MILFCPHIFGESLRECLNYAKEFDSIDEMIHYICETYKKCGGNVNYENIIIGKREKANTKAGWLDPKSVYVKGEEYNRYIGTCVSKYRNIDDLKAEMDSSFTLIKRY